MFGGYKTEKFYSKVSYKVSRKHEKLSNVRSDYIEMWDTNRDQNLSSSFLDSGEQRPMFT